MTRKPHSGYVRKSVVLDLERDADLITWLETQGNASEAIRAALRAHISAGEITLEMVYQAVKTLEAHLSSGQWAPQVGPATTTAPEDPDLAAQLDCLGL